MDQHTTLFITCSSRSTTANTLLGPTAWVALTANLRKSSIRCSISWQPKPRKSRKKTSKHLVCSFLFCYTPCLLDLCCSFVSYAPSLRAMPIPSLSNDTSIISAPSPSHGPYPSNVLYRETPFRSFATLPRSLSQFERRPLVHCSLG